MPCMMMDPDDPTLVDGAVSGVFYEAYLELRCTLCLNLYSNAITTTCWHTFCKSCITSHLETQRYSKCPTCDYHLTVATFIRNKFISNKVKLLKEAFDRHLLQRHINILAGPPWIPKATVDGDCPNAKTNGSVSDPISTKKIHLELSVLDEAASLVTSASLEDNLRNSKSYVSKFHSDLLDCRHERNIPMFSPITKVKDWISNNNKQPELVTSTENISAVKDVADDSGDSDALKSAPYLNHDSEKLKKLDALKLVTKFNKIFKSKNEVSSRESDSAVDGDDPYKFISSQRTPRPKANQKRNRKGTANKIPSVDRKVIVSVNKRIISSVNKSKFPSLTKKKGKPILGLHDDLNIETNNFFDKLVADGKKKDCNSKVEKVVTENKKEDHEEYLLFKTPAVDGDSVDSNEHPKKEKRLSTLGNCQESIESSNINPKRKSRIKSLSEKSLPIEDVTGNLERNNLFKEINSHILEIEPDWNFRETRSRKGAIRGTISSDQASTSSLDNIAIINDKPKVSKKNQSPGWTRVKAGKRELKSKKATLKSLDVSGGNLIVPQRNSVHELTSNGPAKESRLSNNAEIDDKNPRIETVVGTNNPTSSVNDFGHTSDQLAADSGVHGKDGQDLSLVINYSINSVTSPFHGFEDETVQSALKASKTLITHSIHEEETKEESPKTRRIHKKNHKSRGIDGGNTETVPDSVIEVDEIVNNSNHNIDVFETKSKKVLFKNNNSVMSKDAAVPRNEKLLHSPVGMKDKDLLSLNLKSHDSNDLNVGDSPNEDQSMITEQKRSTKDRALDSSSKNSPSVVSSEKFIELVSTACKNSSLKIVESSDLTNMLSVENRIPKISLKDIRIANPKFFVWGTLLTDSVQVAPEGNAAKDVWFEMVDVGPKDETMSLDQACAVLNEEIGETSMRKPICKNLIDIPSTSEEKSLRPTESITNFKNSQANILSDIKRIGSVNSAIRSNKSTEKGKDLFSSHVGSECKRLETSPIKTSLLPVPVIEESPNSAEFYPDTCETFIDLDDIEKSESRLPHNKFPPDMLVQNILPCVGITNTNKYIANSQTQYIPDTYDECDNQVNNVHFPDLNLSPLSKEFMPIQATQTISNKSMLERRKLNSSGVEVEVKSCHNTSRLNSVEQIEVTKRRRKPINDLSDSEDDSLLIKCGNKYKKPRKNVPDDITYEISSENEDPKRREEKGDEEMSIEEEDGTIINLDSEFEESEEQRMKKVERAVKKDMMIVEKSRRKNLDKKEVELKKTRRKEPKNILTNHLNILTESQTEIESSSPARNLRIRSLKPLNQSMEKSSSQSSMNSYVSVSKSSRTSNTISLISPPKKLSQSQKIVTSLKKAQTSFKLQASSTNLLLTSCNEEEGTERLKPAHSSQVKILRRTEKRDTRALNSQIPSLPIPFQTDSDFLLENNKIVDTHSTNHSLSSSHKLSQPLSSSPCNILHESPVMFSQVSDEEMLSNDESSACFKRNADTVEMEDQEEDAQQVNESGDDSDDVLGPTPEKSDHSKRDARRSASEFASPLVRSSPLKSPVSHGDSPPRFVVSLTTLADKEMVQELATRLGGSVVNEVDDTITHLIVRPLGKTAPKTYKFVCAVACGKWVVSVDWVVACLRASRRVPEEEFELFDQLSGLNGPERSRLSPLRVFRDFAFYCCPPFDAEVIHLKQLQNLLRMAGGLVVDNPAPTQPHGRKYFLVIAEHSREQLTFQKWFMESRTLALDFNWTLDCISAHELSEAYLAICLPEETFYDYIEEIAEVYPQEMFPFISEESTINNSKKQASNVFT